MTKPKAITITIHTDNAAFGDAPEFEVARILRELSRRLGDRLTDTTIRDLNGNRVGTVTLSED